MNSAVSIQPTLKPVLESQRVDSVDILRGVALLGILVINIDFFALPGTIFFDPSSAGGFEGLDLLTWKFGTLFFLQKMMAIFSMLFGAGVILMHQRAEGAGRSGFAGVWYRRTFWLLLLGLVHAYLMWYGSILVALGHVALVMLICKAGLLRWLTDRLAAVGRMAFTNYFTQTILCTTLFYGFGFGLFGSVNRFGLIWIVFAIWVLQLLYSPWWLKRFRFGPMEWLWRSLTYWKRQPMRVME